MHADLDSVFNVTKQVIDEMCEQGWGGSSTSRRSMARRASWPKPTSAAKAGIHGFSMALAQEVACW